MNAKTLLINEWLKKLQADLELCQIENFIHENKEAGLYLKDLLSTPVSTDITLMLLNVAGLASLRKDAQNEALAAIDVLLDAYDAYLRKAIC